MVTMTLREALEIQSKQIKHYGHLHPQGVEGLAADMKARTRVEGMDLDAEMPVTEINRYVPRGSDIEFLLGVDYGGE